MEGTNRCADGQSADVYFLTFHSSNQHIPPNSVLAQVSRSRIQISGLCQIPSLSTMHLAWAFTADLVNASTQE
jgi:hypothetical protein